MEGMVPRNEASQFATEVSHAARYGGESSSKPQLLLEASVTAAAAAAASSAPAGDYVNGMNIAASHGPACSHAACSAHPFCLVAELERAAKSYVGKRSSEFKVKALLKGISTLKALGEPIKDERDVNKLLPEV